MVQAPHAPPLILEATNRKTVGTGEVVLVHFTVVRAQATYPSIGPGKHRRPPDTEEANVAEDLVVVPKSALP